MFERWLRKAAEPKSPERKEPKVLVPGFVEDLVMEQFAQELDNLYRRTVYARHEKPADNEPLATIDARFETARTGEMGQKLHAYLEPYINIPQEQLQGPVSPLERQRWLAARHFKQPEK